MAPGWPGSVAGRRPDRGRAHPRAREQRTLARLLVSPRWVVAHHHGTETWLPGPAAGGVVRIQRTEDQLFCRDAEGRALAALHRGWSAEREAFDAVVGRHGITVEDHPSRTPDVGLDAPEQWPPGEGVGRRGTFGPREQGNVSLLTTSVMAALVPFLVVLGLLGGLAHPAGLLAVVPGLVLGAAWWRSASWLRGWQRGDPPRHLCTIPPDGPTGPDDDTEGATR